MNLTFSDFNNEFVEIYLDNILVDSEIINNTWTIFRKSLSTSSSLNYIENLKKKTNLESIGLSIQATKSVLAQFQQILPKLKLLLHHPNLPVCMSYSNSLD